MARTQVSPRNAELAARRPDPTARGTVYHKGSLFQRGGGRFLTQSMMASIRRAEHIINSQVNRGVRKLRALNDGDAYQ